MNLESRPKGESRGLGSASERPLRVTKDRVGENHNEEEREGHKKSGAGSGSGVLGLSPRICTSSCFALDRERVVEKDEAARVRGGIGRPGIYVRIWGEQHVSLVELTRTDAR